MAKKYSHDVFYGEVKRSTVDYKVALDQADEDAGLADYFAAKICSKNLDIDACFADANLVYCEIDNHKVVLSPDTKGSSRNSEIIIDSYPILDTGAEDTELPRQRQGNTAYLFPMQLATGSIRRITIARSQNDEGSIGNIYIGVYANNKPTAIGARLVFDTITSPPEEQHTDGAFIYNTVLPEIQGYAEVEGKQVQNTFFYVIFRVEEDAPGYKILARDTDLTVLSQLSDDGIVTFGNITNFDYTFHKIFDYTVDTSQTALKKMRTPYMNVTMLV